MAASYSIPECYVPDWLACRTVTFAKCNACNSGFYNPAFCRNLYVPQENECPVCQKINTIVNLKDPEPKRYGEYVLDVFTRAGVSESSLFWKCQKLAIAEAKYDVYSEFDLGRSCRYEVLIEADCQLQHEAAKSGALSTIKRLLSSVHKEELVPLFVEHRDPNDDYKTMLIQAAEHGHVSVVKFLAGTANANVRAASYSEDADRSKSTAIHLAAETGHLKVVSVLLKADRDLLEVRDKNGWSPMCRAAKAGQLEVVKYFIDGEGVELVNREHEWHPALYAAFYSGNLNIVKYLIEKGANCQFISDKHINKMAGYRAGGCYWSLRCGSMVFRIKDKRQIAKGLTGDLVEKKIAAYEKGFSQLSLAYNDDLD